MSKKLTSIVLALMMVLSVMIVGIVSVSAEPVVSTIDLPEWEWAITNPSTGNLVDQIQEPSEIDVTGYSTGVTVPEDVDTVKIELYHWDWNNPNWNPRVNDVVVLEKEVKLSELSSDSVATYTYSYRDDNMVYHSETHALDFDHSTRQFSIPYSIPSRRSGGTAMFINKQFMDDLYRDKIIEECGEVKSFADWVNNQTPGAGYRFCILSSTDGENWMKLTSFNGVVAEVVGENQDVYAIRSRTTVYWDYSIPHLGSRYWMITESFTGISGSKYVTPDNVLATGTLTCYDYGDEINSDSTVSDYYEAYINAPDEYKTETLNVRGGVIMFNTPEIENINYITQSGGSEQSIVTLDYDTANLRVTVPTVLPVSVDSDNNVTVADNAQISNLSNGSVDVTNAEIQTDEWSVVGFDTDFTKVPVDTKQYGFKLNGDDVSDGVNTSVFNTINGNDHIGLSYDTNVAIQSQPITNEDIGRIVFTVAWHK